MRKLTVRVTFSEELLATRPANDQIHEEFIAANAPDAPTREEEIAAKGPDEVVEHAMAVFPREDGVPFMWDYQWKGFFKSVQSAFNRLPAVGKRKNPKYMAAYRKIIDTMIFVRPRKVFLHLPEGGEIGYCQRPLRASTAQGERVALAHSETVPIGTMCEFEVYVLDENHLKNVREWLEYGEWHGHGQWRSSGKGRFTIEMQ